MYGCVCVSLFSPWAGMGIFLDKSQSQISPSHFLLRHGRGHTLREIAVWDECVCGQDADGAADPGSAVPSAGNFLRNATAASIPALLVLYRLCHDEQRTSVLVVGLQLPVDVPFVRPTYLPPIHPSHSTHTSSLLLLPCCPEEKKRANEHLPPRSDPERLGGKGEEYGGGGVWLAPRTSFLHTAMSRRGRGGGVQCPRFDTCRDSRVWCLSVLEREQSRADGAVGTNKAMLIAHTSVPFHARTREERREIGGEGREG
ncbi:hypothetical protein K456DRAFT_1349328 [Colletotrichum gloeosporioides 23]|nr:hypothetical protein K456DRAFT_1349328 [Colletotrichum gloeosporioides 23]